MIKQNSMRMEQYILWLSFGAGVLFAIVEFLSAIYMHSQSVLMDAAYDSSELIVIIFTLFLTPLFHKPLSEKHPYGFLQVESIFVIVKGFMMLSVSLGLSVNSLNVAFSGGNSVDGGQISLLQLVLGTVSLFIYLIMHRMNRSVSSPTVNAELLGWKLDIAYSIGLSLAFFASTFLDQTPLSFISPYFDQIVAILIVAFMLPENIKMLWRAIQDVFLFSPENSIVEQIKDDCSKLLEEFSFYPVFYDITRTGRKLWVSIYFRIEEDNLSISKLQKASHMIQESLREDFDNCSSELIVVSEESPQLLKARLASPDL